MVKKIISTKVPLWFVVLILLILTGGVISGVIGSFKPPDNYNIFLDNGNSDLSQMKIRFYDKGVIVKEAPIITKGRKGSWWETPTGIYKIENKEESHFSSIGKVYQPWSLTFQGNFFIHGWPYYQDGKEVSSSYSGGCIRLKTEDAKALYELASAGTPVLVSGKDFESDNFNPRLKMAEISAESYLVADLKSNFVFMEKNKGEKLAIASLTKLMTAVVAAEYVNLDKQIEITSSMIAQTSKPRLRVGDNVSAFNLLYPLLLESSNEAAIALSRPLGPIRFVELMDYKANALGMADTSFADPTGSSGGNVSTAEDLFNFARYLYHNRSFILNLTTGMLNKTAYGAPVWNNLENFNIFGDNPDFIGGKVGKNTAAKETMLAIFNLEIDGETRPIVIIILGADDVGGGVGKVLAYLKNRY
ncbi:MAG: L,D-transpeptidase family protein [Candidatus Colwellbacteria bacterium]|nr:L,D-transpeptidase family protein [Candidatus Colwellbacteria bacterium]